VHLTGFAAWWIRRTYYLFQMPRWDRRLRIVLDWTVALFFRPDITKMELRVEREQVRQAREMAGAAVAGRGMQAYCGASPRLVKAGSSLYHRSSQGQAIEPRP